MEMNLILGLSVGIAAYTAKYYMFGLLLLALDKITTFLFDWKISIWAKRSTFALVVMDGIFGVMAGHMIGSGNQVGTIALVTFAFCSMLSIMLIRFTYKHREKIKKVKNLILPGRKHVKIRSYDWDDNSKYPNNRFSNI